MNIVLTGFMAVGKTEISKAVAEMTHCNRIDTDDMIVEKIGMTINEYFAKYGEEKFREIEREVVKEAAGHKNAVIATGGGVVLDRRNVDELRKTGVVINLSPDFGVIKERLEAARATRPLLKHDSIEDVEKRFNDRKPYYDNCDYKIHVTSGKTPRMYAEEILAIMKNVK